MQRSSIARTHLAGAVGAVAVISAFLVSASVTELAGDAGAVRMLRHVIVFGLPLLIGCLVTAALTGRRLAGRSRAAVIRRKQRRMRLVAAAGVTVLIPCALMLNYLAGPRSLIAGLEIAELLAGAANLSLLVLNFRDGRDLTRGRRSARRARRLRAAERPAGDDLRTPGFTRA
jgi:hypothetical protein